MLQNLQNMLTEAISLNYERKAINIHKLPNAKLIFRQDKTTSI